MGTFIVKHWFIALPATATGIYLLNLMRHLYREKMNQAQPIPVMSRKRD